MQKPGDEQHDFGIIDVEPLVTQTIEERQKFQLEEPFFYGGSSIGAGELYTDWYLDEKKLKRKRKGPSVCLVYNNETIRYIQHARIVVTPRLEAFRALVLDVLQTMFGEIHRGKNTYPHVKVYRREKLDELPAAIYRYLKSRSDMGPVGAKGMRCIKETEVSEALGLPSYYAYYFQSIFERFSEPEYADASPYVCIDMDLLDQTESVDEFFVLNSREHWKQRVQG